MKETKKKLRNSTKVKTTSPTVLLFSVFLLSALAGAQFVGKVSAEGYTEYAGTLGGADFVARFPEPWNGMLVVFCRFYWPFAITAATALEYQNATVSELLNQGFAVAASSYGSTGLCIQAGVNRTHELTMYIINTYHITGKVFLWGVSMGGAVALLLGEKYPKIYSGVLDACGIKDLKEQYAIATNKAGIELETGGTPTTQPKAYEERSPTYHANITIPVITIHGTNDTNVPFNQSIMYQTAVANAGRSNLYRLYNMTGEGHFSAAITAQQPARFAELVEWSNTLTGSIALTPAAQAPGASISVSGASFGVQKPVGVGFGAEIPTAEANMTHSNTGTGPYSSTGYLAYRPIKPGSLNLTLVNLFLGIVSYYEDLGNGTLVNFGLLTVNYGTINYVTGEWTRTALTDLTLMNHYFNAKYTRYEYNVTPAAGVTTLATGAFSASITVPGVVNGGYAVTAVDTEGHIATARLIADMTIPEGLTVGVMVLFSTVAAMVGIRCFRKPPRRESCSLGKTVEICET